MQSVSTTKGADVSIFGNIPPLFSPAAPTGYHRNFFDLLPSSTAQQRMAPFTQMFLNISRTLRRKIMHEVGWLESSILLNHRCPFRKAKFYQFFTSGKKLLNMGLFREFGSHAQLLTHLGPPFPVHTVHLILLNSIQGPTT
jgi:hypothetical protein